MALDRPFEDGRVQPANLAVSASTVSVKNMTIESSCSGQNDLYISDISHIVDRAETGVSNPRGMGETAELDPNGARRAETSRGGIKW